MGAQTKERFVAADLVSPAMQFLTPGVIGRTTHAYGPDRNEIQQFVMSSAVPALRVAFNNVAVVGGSAALFVSILQQSSKVEGKVESSVEE
jgi:hypothetical protein